ncbi:MAG: methyltransferase domain-containing protein [Candidatus Aminicenantaceae bacterium]
MKHTGERDIPEEVFMNPRFQREMACYEFCERYVKNKFVLDQGCGEGYGTFYFSQHAFQVIGIDAFHGVIKEAQRKYQRANLKFCTMDVTRLGFADESFDITTSMAVIEHIKDYPRHIEEAARITKPGGIFILSALNSLQSLHDDAFHFNEFDNFQLKEMLEPYFIDLDIYGLRGITQRVIRYRKDRQKYARKFIRFDPLNLRKFIPQQVYSKIYNFFQTKMRIELKNKYNDDINQITTEDFSVTKNKLESAWNFICVAKKK